MRLILILFCAAIARASGVTSGVPPHPTISTASVDNNRTGWNHQEYKLNPSNVPNLTKLGVLTVDGYVYAQPLYIPSVNTSGVQHDLVVIATMNNSVYAFDANSLSSTPVWNVNLGTARTSYAMSPADLYSQPVGILGTPVADVSNGHVFVVSATTAPSYTLYELNLETGATVNSVTITGSVTGTGDPEGSDCVSGGVLSFCPEYETQRAALTLANGNVYIPFGAFGDNHPWHGWLFAYSATTLSQVALFCTSPNGYGAAIWNSGGGLAVDGSGNLYGFTGNGTWDGTSDYGVSMLKFSSTLSLLDWFTPSNYASLNNSDLDVSSGRPMLMPGEPVLFGSGKDSRLIMVSTSNMGHLQGSGTAPLQIFTFGTELLYGGAFSGSMAYFQNSSNSAEPLLAFTWNGASFDQTPVTGSSYGFPGAQYSGSSGDFQNGVLWMTNAPGGNHEPSSPPNGTLYALNPLTLQVLYSDSSLGLLSKFAAPLVANGRVFVATQSGYVAVYGLP